MAKKSSIAKNLKRALKAARAAEKRTALKLAIKKGSPEESEAALAKLQKCDRNESKIRVRERCRQCGRPCGTYRKFGLCRIHLREAAMRGDVPGLKKASW